MTGCKVADCDRRHQAHGWCNMHYQRWLRSGDPGDAVVRQYASPLEALFARRRVEPSGCWIWTGTVTDGGYGILNRLDCDERMAHRAAYLLLVGPIAEGLQLDHLCRTPACINPDHLEPVTRAENVRRSGIAEAARAQGARRTACPKGHPWDDANTYREAATSARQCRTCHRDRERARYRARQAVPA